MIAIIRIVGMIDVDRDVAETLDRIRLRRKFACVVVREKPEIEGVLKKVGSLVAYGKIDEATFTELVKKRGKPLPGKKVNAEAIAKEFMESKTGKRLSELGIKDFFRLHPPRGGIESKKHYPKGVLGNHGDKINELIRRML